MTTSFVQRLMSTMSREPKRYFRNPYPEYDPSTKEGEPGFEAECFRAAERVAGGAPGREMDGGLYVGPAGVAYAMMHAAQAPALGAKREQLLAWARELIRPHVVQCEKGRDPKQAFGFLLGNAGVYAVAAALAHDTGDHEGQRQYLLRFAQCCPPASPSDFLGCGSNELFVGRAGYLCAAIWLKNYCLGGSSYPVPPERLHPLWSAIVAGGRPAPLMYSYYGTEYLGAAHGLCAILQVLMSFPEFLKADPAAEKDIKGSVDWYVSLQEEDGNFPCATDETGRGKRKEEDMLVHWCHGAPGAVYMLAKAYLTWKDQRYLDAALRCGECIWNKGLLRKGPGICHGVAGNGYVFLLLHRLTGDQRHLYRARRFASFMQEDAFLRGARTPDCPFSLYEGLAGTVCFLADLTRPQEAHFPFFDIFKN